MEKTFDDQDTLRALSLKWHPIADSFIFCFKEEVILTPSASKRLVLSVIAKLFDPLGWLAPIVVSAKIFLQTLWKTELKWDDPLPKPFADQWNQFTSELKASTVFSIPRWLGTLESSTIEIHCFSDASRAAMAAVVYVRVVAEDFNARSTLPGAKTRMAPLKPVVIARLELSAAVGRIQTSLNRSHAPIHLWTDSSVALTWMNGNPLRWKEYVANRVAVIKELLPNAHWHHVAGAANPADVDSRGLLPIQLREHPIWWNGPEWLKFPSTWWPNSLPMVADGTDWEERPATVLLAKPQPEVWELIDCYPRLETLLRVTARVFDAVECFRRKRRNGADHHVIPHESLTRSFHFWIRETQQVYLAKDIRTLKGGSTLPRSSLVIRLLPFLDSEDLLRLGGRLQKSPLDMDVKHPFIIPRHSTLARLLIEQAHRRTFHGGTQLTLSFLRQRVWIIGGRTRVKSFIQKCVPCTRQRGAVIQQKMGQLPLSRLTPARPFKNSGVDYAGPILVKASKLRKAKTYKAYLVLFVCFATSAVHLELATDCSTDGFVAVLRRFFGRRGICSHFTSDCGTNFVGADAALKTYFAAASKEFAHLRLILADDQVTWHFHPPSAPHFGGKWEAAVKSVKFHLRRILGHTLLTYEEFSTLLIQIEGVLNSRPLSPYQTILRTYRPLLPAIS